ncbi:hypothetical protein EXA13_04280 [Vibrio cincinnatiensis]|nr:hypothetical protein [Vibrio cincinnatiensis]
MIVNQVMNDKRKTTGHIMIKTSNSSLIQSKPLFTPKMENFKVSLAYEGLSLKAGSEKRSIEELKRDYAR